MSRRPPTPVRFDTAVAIRLQTYVAAHPGLSLSSAANRLVDEGLRTTEHPGITFREGPTGRRAGLVGGPDVWEVVRVLRSARAAEPELDENALVSLVAENAGLQRRLLRTALRYWAAYPTRSTPRSPLPTTRSRRRNGPGSANTTSSPGDRERGSTVILWWRPSIAGGVATYCLVTVTVSVTFAPGGSWPSPGEFSAFSWKKLWRAAEADLSATTA